jgi:quercetin dioxygenase-like cupin family protein
MNISALHIENSSVSAKQLFKGEGQVIAIQIIAGQQLKEHITKVPALLLCVEGEVVYKDEQQREVTLLPGDYHPIEPMVKHWLDAVSDSNLILMK